MTYIPQWQGAIEAYSKNQVRANLWKLEALGYDFEDLLHVAVECFCVCRDRYKVENAKHFMGLFKMCLHNKFYDLARVASLERGLIVETSENVLNFLNQGFCESEGTFRVLLKNAPTEIKQVLSLVLNAPNELLESIGFSKKKDKGFCANKRLCRLLGYNSDEINLVQRVKEYLSL